MKQLPGLTPAWLICLALTLGTVIVVLIPISIAGGEIIKANDWIGFAGSVVGGTMTLIAAVMAWFAVQRQMDFQIEQKNHDRQEAYFAATIVLAQTVHAAAVVASINKSLITHLSTPPVGGSANLIYSGQTNKMFGDLDAIFKQLKNAMTFFAVSEAWRDLGADTKASYLVVTACLHRLVRVYESPPLNRAPLLLLQDRHTVMLDFAKYIRAFSVDLADVFDRDAGL